MYLGGLGKTGVGGSALSRLEMEWERIEMRNSMIKVGEGEGVIEVESVCPYMKPPADKNSILVCGMTTGLNKATGCDLFFLLDPT